MKVKTVLWLVACSLVIVAGNVTLAQAKPIAGAQTRTNNIISRLGSVTCENERLSDCKSQSSASLRDYVADRVEAGWSDSRILAKAASTYGNGILLEPSKNGFNIALWASPFLLVAAGLAMVFLLIRASMKNNIDAKPVGGRVKSDAYSAKLADELRHFDF